MDISKGIYQVGVATLVREDMQHHSEQIERVGHRFLKITLSTKTAVAPIVVLANFAPQNRYTVGVRKQHWALAQETISEIPTTGLFIWREDAIGELVGRNRNGPKINKVIAMIHMARSAEPGNGRKLGKSAQSMNSPPMNACGRQPKTT